MSIGSNPVIPNFKKIMQLQKLSFFKKNQKQIKLNKLYSELLKTKHLLNFFLATLKKKQLIVLYKTISKAGFLSKFLSTLETRLDFLLIKSHFALNGKHVKQLIGHGHILVNNNKVFSSAFKLKKFDLISLKKESIFFMKKMLVKGLFKTSLFTFFLRKKKKIIKKHSLNNLIIYSKFPAYLEINFRTFNILFFRKLNINECFLPRVVSLYDYNQLHFVS